jgi:multiple sugar transport system permease protein
MVDVAHPSLRPPLSSFRPATSPAGKGGLRRLMRRRTTTAVLMCLPLILVVGGLIVYPAFYSIYLSMLNKAQTKFVGLGNFKFLFGRDTFWTMVEQAAFFLLAFVFFKALVGLIVRRLSDGGVRNKYERRGEVLVPWVIPLALTGLSCWWLFDPAHSALTWLLTPFGIDIGSSSDFGRDTFWMVVEQSTIFALSAVFFKALIGLITAHLVNNLPSKGQRKWRGMLLVPWVIPLALSTLGWWWLFDPTYSAFNYLIQSLGGGNVAFLSAPYWARFSVILVNVWYGAPFFLIMYLAALKSVPEQLYEAAEIDGANAWQRFRHVTLPMMRNIIAITVLFSLIVTFANFDIVQIMTAGGPRNMTHVFATYAFLLGIRSGDIPLGAAVSLFMVPILGISAVFILRGVRKRGREIG